MKKEDRYDTMGNKVSLEDEMVNLRIVSKQMQRSAKKCEKNEKSALDKLKKVSVGVVADVKFFLKKMMMLTVFFFDRQSNKGTMKVPVSTAKTRFERRTKL